MRATVGGFENAFASVVNRVGVVRRGHDGRRPLKAMVEPARAARIAQFRRHGDVLDLVRAPVEARDVALIVAGIHNVRVGWIGRNIACFPAPDGVPIVAANLAAIAAAGNGHGGIILLRAVDVVRGPRVGDDVVELRGGLVVLARPRIAAIEADRDAAVVRGNHALRILRIDPETVIVAVRNFHFIEAAPAVGGLEELDIRDVERIGIVRIGDDVHVVPRALKQRVATVYEIPGVAAVVGTIKSAVFFSFDNRVDAFGVRRHRQPDAPVGTLRKPVLLQPFPGGAAIG